jgi:hypothetical protein
VTCIHTWAASHPVTILSNHSCVFCTRAVLEVFPAATDVSLGTCRLGDWRLGVVMRAMVERGGRAPSRRSGSVTVILMAPVVDVDTRTIVHSVEEWGTATQHSCHLQCAV